MTTLPPRYCLCCGAEITKDQHCVETPEQFAKRYNESYCRAKCKRLHTPPKPERVKPTLELKSCNTERPELVAQPYEEIPRSVPYKQFIREQDCLLMGMYCQCIGDVAPHHTEGAGMSIKGSDFSCVPLCASHHLLMDNAGKKGRGIWTPGELAKIVARLNEEFNRLMEHKIKRGK